MPKRIFIIALLFCLAGAYAIYGIVEGLFNNHLNIDLSIFMLPVGIGLFKGKASSRWWARFWLILGYVLCGAMIILSAAMPSWAHADLLGRKLEGAEALPYVWTLAVVLLAVLIALHKLLYSMKSEAYFARASGRPGILDPSQECDRNFRRESAMEHKRYNEFNREFPEVAGLTSKERHDQFRLWLAGKTTS